MSSFPSWWLKVGDFVVGEDTNQIGVILEVKEPGIIRIRWGTDERSDWYNMNEFAKVRLR